MWYLSEVFQEETGHHMSSLCDHLTLGSSFEYDLVIVQFSHHLKGWPSFKVQGMCVCLCFCVYTIIMVYS